MSHQSADSDDDSWSARRAAQEQWSRNPAGTIYVSDEEGTPEFYARMTQVRYELQPWHPDLLRRFAPTGRLLEVGCGAGTDHFELAKMAQSTVAIDLAHHGASLTKRRLDLAGGVGRALVADGEAMPFADQAFDSVYSFGVIHHTDHPQAVAAEMYRVLRPGGRFLVAVYHRASVFTLATVLRWLKTGILRRERWAHFLARIEGGAEELSERPLIRLYSRAEAARLFANFSNVRTEVLHFGGDPRTRPFTRSALAGALARRWGWYVVVTGNKAAHAT